MLTVASVAIGHSLKHFSMDGPRVKRLRISSARKLTVAGARTGDTTGRRVCRQLMIRHATSHSMLGPRAFDIIRPRVAPRRFSHSGLDRPLLRETLAGRRRSLLIRQKISHGSR